MAQLQRLEAKHRYILCFLASNELAHPLTLLARDNDDEAVFFIQDNCDMGNLNPQLWPRTYASFGAGWGNHQKLLRLIHERASTKDKPKFHHFGNRGLAFGNHDPLMPVRPNEIVRYSALANLDEKTYQLVIDEMTSNCAETLIYSARITNSLFEPLYHAIFGAAQNNHIPLLAKLLALIGSIHFTTIQQPLPNSVDELITSGQLIRLSEIEKFYRKNITAIIALQRKIKLQKYLIPISKQFFYTD